MPPVPPVCEACGALTERVWLSHAQTVIGDECDFIQHNGTREPIRFRSRAEFRRWLKETGWEVKDTHVPKQGTDKSPFTTNWGSRCDAYTANNVRILMERAFQQKPDPPDEPVNIRWVNADTGLPE